MIFTRGLRVCLALQPADLRRSFDGLALLIREELEENECSSQIFVFTNKRRNRVSVRRTPYSKPSLLVGR